MNRIQSGNVGLMRTARPNTEKRPRNRLESPDEGAPASVRALLLTATRHERPLTGAGWPAGALPTFPPTSKKV